MPRTEIEILADAPAMAAFLANKITSIDSTEEDEWYQSVEMTLSSQSKESLELLLAESAEFNTYHWGALDNIISDFIYGGPVADNSWGEDEPNVTEEFLLLLAFNLVPLVVEEHMPMLSTSPTLNWNGEMDENSVEDMNQMISNAINYLAVEMTLNGRGLNFARGIHLHKTFIDYDSVQLDDETVLFMSENAMVLLANAHKVFNDGFDSDLAKEIVRVQTPILREGVL